MNPTEGIARQYESSGHKRTFEELRLKLREPFDSYQALHARLEQSEGFLGAVEHVRELYAAELADATFLTEQDWEMLSTLWIYDPELMDHSVATYRIARERIERPLELTQHAAVINLSKEFSREGVQLEQFLRACLLHDVGKLAVPLEVLTNHLSDTECAQILFEHYDSLAVSVREVLGHVPDQALPASAADLLSELRTASVRPQRLLPVRYLLSSDAEQASVAETLTHLGLSLDDSLFTIVQTHDTYSRAILTETGSPVEAELAGAHHRHSEGYSPTPYTITIGTLQVSVDLADIIHLADVTQAMESRRRYKEPQPELVVLATLVEHASHGLVDPFITYLWVADEWNRVVHPADATDPHFISINRFLERGEKTYGPELRAYRAA